MFTGLAGCDYRAATGLNAEIRSIRGGRHCGEATRCRADDR
jgi:hypothetical protein